MVMIQVTAMSLALAQRTARGRSEAPMPMIEVATTCVVDTGAPPSDRLAVSLGEYAGTLGPNSFGFLNHTRYMPDRRDLNRSFPGAEHGFAFPQRACYDKPSAERHWTRLFSLFNRNLAKVTA